MQGLPLPLTPESPNSVIYDPKTHRVLDFVFNHAYEAQEFLEACERSGVNLYPGMLHSDIASLVRLWRDASKRR